MVKGQQHKKLQTKAGRPSKVSKGGQTTQKAKLAAAATKAKVAAFAKKQQEMHRSTYTETSKRWSSALKIKSGEMMEEPGQRQQVAQRPRAAQGRVQRHQGAASGDRRHHGAYELPGAGSRARG